jgi:putative SOS response-associated peptidase YedK
VTQEPRDVADLMTPADDDYFDVIAVSDRVNKVANTGADLQNPVHVAARPASKPKEPPANPQLSLF